LDTNCYMNSEKNECIDWDDTCIKLKWILDYKVKLADLEDNIGHGYSSVTCVWWRFEFMNRKEIDQCWDSKKDKRTVGRVCSVSALQPKWNTSDVTIRVSDCVFRVGEAIGTY
jgi:hypothetical protein